MPALCVRKVSFDRDDDFVRGKFEGMFSANLDLQSNPNRIYPLAQQKGRWRAISLGTLEVHQAGVHGGCIELRNSAKL